MRFLTVSPYSRGHGGYERHRRMAQGLIRAGHEVLWLSPGIDFPKGETHLPVVSLRLPSPFGWIVTVMLSLRAHRHVIDGVDAVFTWSEYDSIALKLYAGTANIPHVFFQGGDSVECERFISRNAESLGRRIKSRVMLAYYPILQRFLGKTVDRVVVQGDFLGRLMRARRPEAKWEIDVLPGNCRFEDTLEENDPAVAGRIDALRSDGLLIGVIGQCFYRPKGWDLLIDALSLLKGEPGIRVALIGYGTEAHLIEEAIRERGLGETVHFLGRVGAAHRLMSLFDVIVAPTRFMDACPTVILEAMDADRMIVASDIPGHLALLADPALLFESGDARALADRIRSLRDDAAAREANRALVRERRKVFDFDWDAEAAEIMIAQAKGGRHRSDAVRPLAD